jgi:hypothetical protein
MLRDDDESRPEYDCPACGRSFGSFARLDERPQAARVPPDPALLTPPLCPQTPLKKHVGQSLGLPTQWGGPQGGPPVRGGLHQGGFASVVVSSLEEVNGFIRDTVHQPVFLANSTRPAACQHISKRLRLSEPLEWIPHHCFDQIQHSDRGVAFGFDPKAEVLPELRLKDRDPLRISLHLTSLDGVPRRFLAWSALSPLVVMPIGDAVRCGATATGVQFP